MKNRTILNVLRSFLVQPKKIITLGYQSMIREQNEINYEKLTLNKHHRTQLPTIDLLDLIPDLHETTNDYSFLNDTSLITDILMLKALARRFEQCSYLEIGSLRGESLAAVADVANNCTSITLSDEEMRAFNFDEGYIKVHGLFSKNKPNITTYRHNSQTFDFDTLNKKYDLIFVDGDHSYEGVLQDTKNVFKLLKDENSIIVWHDYGFNVETVRHEILCAILDGAPHEYRQDLYHVSNTMCAIFIKGKFETTFINKVNYPNKVFQVEVKAKKL